MAIILKQLLTLIFWASFQYILLDCRYNRKKAVSIIIAAIAIIFTINVVILQSMARLFYIIYPLTMSLPLVLVFLFLSKHKNLRVWFIFLTAHSLYNVAYLPELLLALRFGYSLIVIMIEILVLLPLLFLVYRYFRPLYLQMVNTMKKGWGLFCIVPLLFNFLVYFLFMENSNDLKQTSNIISIIVAALMVLAVYGIIIIFFRQEQQQFMLQNEQQLLKIQISALQNQSEAVRNAEEKITIYRHDMRHYIQNIQALLQNGDMKTVIEFLGKHDDMFQNTKVPYYCENRTINAILSYYLENAKKDGIEIKTKLDIVEKIPVDPIEICTVFANAIENAINACRKLPEGEKKIIELNCVSRPHFVFEIANTYIGNIQFDDSGYPLSKDKGHGIGTISIAAFVKKHNAIIGYKTTYGMFRVRILLK
ncbi:MAG TPA: GHKL domain-containing protein [Oscillospiraceae bacterium]|nr:GHKL domain-containing protein [Oscillospiraceae bacterium]